MPDDPIINLVHTHTPFFRVRSRWKKMLPASHSLLFLFYLFVVERKADWLSPSNAS